MWIVFIARKALLSFYYFIVMRLFSGSLNSNMKVKCFRKTVPSETNIFVDFSNEIAALMTKGNKIVDCICGATTNSNNALVYGKTAIQATSDWTYVYARVNQNYYDGLGGTTTVTLLAIYE